MNPKKYIQAILDCGRSRQERMYRLLVMLGMIGLLAEIVSGALMGSNLRNFVITAAVFVSFFGIAYYAIHFNKIQLGAVLLGFLIIFFVLPFNFFTGGGIYGGSPIWFLFGVVYVCLVVEGKIKFFLFGCAGILSGVCYHLAYSYPDLIARRTLTVAFVDSFSALCIVTLVICCMILFQDAIYRSENETAQKQKEEIEKLNQAQNRFFSSMSHEIRTPINTIIGLNEMILRDAESDEVAADAKNIQGASKMLLTLINDILDMSKLESGKMDIVPVTYDVGAMLSDIVNMIWVRAKEKGLEFHIDVDQKLPAQLFGDEVRIKQVLINVLNNAVKYTPEGSVTLSIQFERTGHSQARISYSVSDTGMGVKKENIPYLFSAFKRVDGEKNRYIEGTGLGLSIVKQLVDLMDGEIAVNSVYTKGTTFVITLPQEIVGDEEIGELDLETRHAMNVREHYKQSFEAPQAQVLIVDDNATNLMVEEKLLRDTKVKVHTAGSGAECLKNTLQERYDVIFMDHLMPGMDGIECLREIRTQTGGLNQDTPVVILTANAGSENQALYRREGFDGYLLKPVSGAQLERELLSHLPEGLVTMVGAGASAGVADSLVQTHRKKLPLMITTDSVCDLPGWLVEKHKIAVIPFRVLTEGGEFMDGVETETDGILSYIGRKGKHARSEAPQVADYEEFFAHQLSKAQSVIHIAVAQNVSQGYQRAVEASKIFDNVIVVDSGHLSSGMGLMVLRAAEHASAGLTATDVIKELERMKNSIRTSFIVDSTDYLARSDRISSKINSICKVLLLHPVLILKNSSMKVGTVLIGAKGAVRKHYISSALHVMGEIDRRILFITYAGLTVRELKEIEEQVKSQIVFEQVIYQKASPAISTNCGPGTFGLLFMLK